MQWKPTRACTKKIIQREMCDYQEITNTPDKKGIMVSKSNYLNYDMIKLWNIVDTKTKIILK